MISDKTKIEIKKYALSNALFHNGKASINTVIGKIIAQDKELKNNIKELKSVVAEIIENVNKMSLNEQKSQLLELDANLIKKKKHEKGLIDLPGAIMGKVVTRIPPEPSKYLHIGHALSFLINYLYAKKYNGKTIVRFEDTNPLKSSQEFVDSIKEDILDYLQIKPSKIIYVSDDIVKMYKLAKKLIENGEAYVCSCSKEKIHENREKGIKCKCRDNSIDYNLKEWNLMLKGKYNNGERTLRLKIDMNSKNYAMRDPIIFRIFKKYHYRQRNKYFVWPMYDFEAAIEDYLCGITHVLRSNEFGNMRTELQNYIRARFGFKNPIYIQYGRFNITGAITEGRKIRELIESKEISGWDDPRLVTLKALRKRGFVKETYYQLMKEVGLSPTQTNIDITMLETINRKIIDPIAKRYFFIDDPIKITIENVNTKEIKLKIHPEKEKPLRNLKINSDFYISKKDYDEILKMEDNKLIRLIDCFNFIKKGNHFIKVSDSYLEFKNKGEKIIQWLPFDKNQVINATIIMPDNTLKSGLAEYNINELKIGEIIQFIRFGFCRLDHINNISKLNNNNNNNNNKEDNSSSISNNNVDYVFYYTHK